MKYGDGTIRKIRQSEPSTQSGGLSIPSISSIPLTQLRSWNISRIDEDPNAKLSNNQVLTNVPEIKTETKNEEANIENNRKEKALVSFGKGVLFFGALAFTIYTPGYIPAAITVAGAAFNVARNKIWNKEEKKKQFDQFLKWGFIGGVFTLANNSDISGSILVGSITGTIGAVVQVAKNIISTLSHCEKQ